MLEYAYMRKALLVGFFLGMMLPIIGVVLVNRKTPVLGDALSHVSLAGVIGGLLLGINPVAGAMVFAVIAALSIESIRNRYPAFGELSTVIILSTGVGLASLLSGFLSGGGSYDGFLFGSIVSVSDMEVGLVIGISFVVLFLFIRLYQDLLYISVDSESAKIAGVRVKRVNLLFTLMSAMVISIASRTVGVLLISSLMILPVASAIQLAKSYRQTILYASGFGILFTLIGLTIAYYIGLKPGGAIVLTAVIFFVFVFLLTKRNN